MKKGIIMILLSLLILSGCVAKYTEDTYQSFGVLTNINADAALNLGYISAEDTKYIYYFSSELETTGIYCMDKTGSKEELLVEESDILQMQLTEDRLYYLAYEGIVYGDGKSGDAVGNRSYMLKSYDLISGQVESYEKQVLAFENYIRQYRKGWRRGVIGFYYCGDNQFIMSAVDTLIPTLRFGMISGIVDGDVVVPITERFKEYRLNSEFENPTLYYIFDNSKIIMITDQPESTEHLEGLLQTECLYIYDTQSNSGFQSTGAMMEPYPFSKTSIFQIANKRSLIIVDNQIALCELSEKNIVKQMSISDAESLRYIESGSMLLAYQKVKTNVWKYRLYQLDLEQFTIEELCAFDNEEVIAVNEDYILTISNTSLKKYLLNSSDIKIEWEKNMDGNYLVNDAVIEARDNWLFIKKFDVNIPQSISFKMFVGAEK